MKKTKTVKWIWNSDLSCGWLAYNEGKTLYTFNTPFCTNQAVNFISGIAPTWNNISNLYPNEKFIITIEGSCEVIRIEFSADISETRWNHIKNYIMEWAKKNERID